MMKTTKTTTKTKDITDPKERKLVFMKERIIYIEIYIEIYVIEQKEWQKR